MKQKISITIEEAVLRRIDSIVDNITIRNRSQAIEFLAQSALGERKIAVILSGGDERKLRIGSSYRLTVPIGNSTVIERAVKKLRQHGFSEIYIVGQQKILTQIFALLRDGSDYSVRVNYIEEKVSSGSADTLALVKGIVKDNFLAVYGHVLFDRVQLDELWNQHIRNNSVATLLLSTSANPSEKGTVVMEGNRILEFVQKPKNTDVHLVFSAIFVASPEIFAHCKGSLEYDVFPALAQKGLLSGHISAQKEFHIHNLEDVKRV